MILKQSAGLDWQGNPGETPWKQTDVFMDRHAPLGSTAAWLCVNDSRDLANYGCSDNAASLCERG